MSEKKGQETRSPLAVDVPVRVERAGDVIVILDGAGTMISVSPSIRQILGYEPDEITGRPFATLFAEASAEQAIRFVESDSETLHRHRLRLAGTRGDGELVQLELSIVRYTDGDARMAAQLRPIAELMEIEKRLAYVTRRHRLLFDRNLAGIFRADLAGKIVDCNDAYAVMLGFGGREELVPLGLVDPAIDQEERAEIYRRVEELGELTRIETSAKQKDGTPIWILQNLTLVQDSGRQFVEGTAFDITAHKLAEERVEYHSYHDNLTGLPNTELLEEKVAKAFISARKSGRRAAVMLLDLDQFKAINDTRGHAVGNQVLQLVAYRLQKALRHEDAVSRLGGDKFTILAASLPTSRDAEAVVEKVLRTVSQPFLVDGHELYMTGSIGIAIYPEDGEDFDSLLRKADIAMYRAKDLGRNTHVFCAQARSDEVVDQMTIENDLRRALERDEFRLHFQPQIDSLTGSIVGVEALIRWNHPTRGLVQPNDFIPVAERSRLIVAIGEWVLRESCSHAAKWQALRPSLRVSVNLAPRQFHEKDFDKTVASILHESGLRPDLLELEITEGAAMQNPDQALDTLKTLKKMGVRISIDDFGTGYSSLAYLSRFPIDSLKIDQGFVRDIGTAGTGAAIIAAVIALAHQLNLTVVAEGVETEVQHSFLKDHACEQMQGFLFSHPITATKLQILLGAFQG